MKTFRHRLVIETPSISQNTFGENVESWSTLATVWGKIEPKSGASEFDSGTNVQKTQYEIQTWYLSTLTTKCRVKYESRYYQIDGIVNEDQRDRKMILTCTVIDDGSIS